MAIFRVDSGLYELTGSVPPWPTTTPLTSFRFLRDALYAVRDTAGDAHEINLNAGTYNIQDYTLPKYEYQIINGKKVKVQTGWSLASNAARCLARYGARPLAITGETDASQQPLTIITGLSRIYSGQHDRGYGVPSNWTLSRIPSKWTLRDLVLRFDGGSSGYILQSGETTVDTANEIDNLTLSNVVFEGIHPGAVGGDGNLPWGLYLDMRSGNPGGVPDYLGLELDRVKVTLSGQGSGVGQFNPSHLPMTGGSAFLSAQGDTINIKNSYFDESGYRNAITIANSVNVRVSRNIFTRREYYGNRYTGEKFVNVAGVIENNTFLGGAYLEFYDAFRPVKIAGNNFDLRLCGGHSLLFRNSALPDYDLTLNANIDLSGNVFRGGLVARSENTSPSRLVLRSVSGSTNSVVVGTSSYQFTRFYVGGLAADALDGRGSADKDWISGDVGNDTLIGGGGADAFVFSSALDSGSNVDVITDFRASGSGGVDKIWLDKRVFAGLAVGSLAAADFGTAAATGADIVYNSGSLYFANGGASELSGYAKFATLTGSPSLTRSHFLVF